MFVCNRSPLRTPYYTRPTFCLATGHAHPSVLVQLQLTDHGGPTSQGSLGALAEVIYGCGTTVWHLEVGVDVDATRDHHLPIGLDGFHTSRDNEVVPDLPVGLEQQSI